MCEFFFLFCSGVLCRHTELGSVRLKRAAGYLMRSSTITVSIRAGFVQERSDRNEFRQINEFHWLPVGQLVTWLIRDKPEFLYHGKASKILVLIVKYFALEINIFRRYNVVYNSGSQAMVRKPLMVFWLPPVVPARI